MRSVRVVRQQGLITTQCVRVPTVATVTTADDLATGGIHDGKEIDTLISEAPSIKTGPNTYAGWDGLVPSLSEFSVRFALAKAQGTARVLNLLPKGGGDSFSIEIDVAIDDTVQTLRSARFASP